MYIIKNALRTIGRTKGRNILIGIIVLVISVSSCIALSIRQAAASAKESGLESLQITASISIDRQSMMQAAQDNEGGDFRDMLQASEDLTLEEMQLYAESNYVKDFYYSISASFDGSDELEAISTSGSSTDSAEDTATTDNNMPQGMGGGMDGSGEKSSPPGGMGAEGDFTIVGYSSQTSMTAFVDGTSYLSDGEMFDETSLDNLQCIISDELAALNETAIGDTITVVNPNDDTETFELIVTGTYTNTEASTTGQSMMGFSASSDPTNEIYTTYNILQSMLDSSEANATTETDEETGRTNTTAVRSQTSGTYVFSDVDNYEAFTGDVYEMGLSEDYTVSSTDVTAYEQSLVPLDNLSTFATYFLLVVLLIGGIILVVFSLFNIRERKYEIGVLTAIGMKKPKVGLQFVIEFFSVTLITIIIGTIIGAAASVPVANALLENQISSQEQQQTQQMENFGGAVGGPGTTTDATGDTATTPARGGFSLGDMTDYVNEVSSATNLTVVLQLMGICIFLTVISSLVAVIFVMRYEPLKILSNRS